MGNKKFSQFIDGVFYLNDDPLYLATTDYPYYRDDPMNWADRLEKIKAMGHDIITWYIPWRHHEIIRDGNQLFDFSGETQPNRDVLGFLSLCAEKDMKVIIKPGPFVHAEINYGGLPDFVCPLFCENIEPMLDFEGNPVQWAGARMDEVEGKPENWPLPAWFGLNFQMAVKTWYGAVYEQVLKTNVYPKGPIIAVQIANEGVYSNHQHAPWAYDYSHSSTLVFREFLKQKYLSLDKYNRLHEPHIMAWDEILPPVGTQLPEMPLRQRLFADWAAFQADYMARIYKQLKDLLPVDLPFVVNVNPPLADDYGVDAWLSRVNPDVWPDINYGFTNWIGAACENPTVAERYQVMIKRARGINLEENWGFSKIYEAAFASETVSYYQTLLLVASGCTGHNVYTGVGTAHADIKMDLVHRGVYPDCSPIDEFGEPTSKERLVYMLNRFFEARGAEWMSCETKKPFAWGLYLPYAHLAVWHAEQIEGAAQCGKPLIRLIREALAEHTDFGLLNLQTARLDQLMRYASIVLEGTRFMDRDTQEILSAYIQKGGRLVVIGQIPILDEELNPCTTLKSLRDQIILVSSESFYQEGLLARMPELTSGKVTCSASDVMIWNYSLENSDIGYVFVFSGLGAKEDIEGNLRVGENDFSFGVKMPAASACVFRYKANKITDYLIKGVNDYTGKKITPMLRFGEQVIQFSEPADILKIKDGEELIR